MKPAARTALSMALLVGAWAVVLIGWPATTAACFAGLLALVAVFLAPI
jgi:hypothetical protein